MKHGLPAFLGITLLATSLMACDPNQPQKPTGQAIVRVNGEEITIHQVNYGLARLPKQQSSTDELTRKVAEQYVDQQLLLQKALEEDLQKEANVQQVLEETRRQVLAEAYLERALGYVPSPDTTQINAYYRAHPELFSERRLYELQQLLVNKSLPFVELERKTQSGVDALKLVTWLEAKRALLGVQNEVVPAEKISAELLSKLHRMKRGQRLASRAADGHVVTIVIEAYSRPLSEKQAAPAIEQFLRAEKRRLIADRLVDRLRQEAKIEWREDFRKSSAVVVGDVARVARNGKTE